MNLPTDHPMHLGHDPGAFLPKADVVIVIDSVVPWMPRNHQPRKDAKVIHISADPLRDALSVPRARSRPAGQRRVAGGHDHVARILADAMKGKKTAIESRRKALAAMREDIQGKRAKLIETVKDQTPIHPAWLAALHQPGEIRGRHRDQRARRSASGAEPDQAAELYGRASFRRARLRARRRSRRQARRAAARGDRDRRRRLLHVRQPDPLSLRRRAPRACRRSRSSPTTSPGTRCGNPPSTSFPTATPPRPT